jgi:hypothetical protein
MKRAQRQKWQSITNIGLPHNGLTILCSFCRYAEFDGPCKGPDVECNHPVLLRWQNEPVIEDARSGCDCWGFSPDLSFDIAVDVVGIWLQGKLVDWSSN